MLLVVDLQQCRRARRIQGCGGLPKARMQAQVKSYNNCDVACNEGDEKQLLTTKTIE